MHAVVTRVTFSNREEAEDLLRERLVPAAREAPGFVGGFWMNLAPDRGTSVIVFESEEAARAWEDQVAPPSDVVTIDSVEVGEVMANA